MGRRRVGWQRREEEDESGARLASSLSEISRKKDTFKGGTEMKRSSNTLSRWLLPVGSLVFCASIVAGPVPRNKDPQKTPPANPNKNKTKTTRTARA